MSCISGSLKATVIISSTVLLEDIIYLLKELTVVIDTLSKLKVTLAQRLDRYITKN